MSLLRLIHWDRVFWVGLFMLVNVAQYTNIFLDNLSYHVNLHIILEQLWFGWYSGLSTNWKVVGSIPFKVSLSGILNTRLPFINMCVWIVKCKVVTAVCSCKFCVKLHHFPSYKRGHNHFSVSCAILIAQFWEFATIWSQGGKKLFLCPTFTESVYRKIWQLKVS